MSNGWIGFDLDGTLAHYDGWKGANHIGAPVPEMVNLVKQQLAQGVTVKIFTARAYHDGTPQRVEEAAQAVLAIGKWCQEHIGQVLEVTCVKDYAMIALYDDRCWHVEQNTGRILG